MSYPEQPITTYIRCGGHKLATTAFNDQSTIDQVHEQVRSLCGPHIPNEYCLMFYHVQLKKIIKFNQYYLSEEVNLFRSSSSIAAHDENSVELWVIDTTDEYEIPSGITCHETVKEAVSEEDIPISAGETNVNNCSGGDLLCALLNKEQDNIDILMQNISDQESSPTYSNESQSNAGFSPNLPSLDNTNPDCEDLHEALLTDKQPVQDLLINNNSSESIATEVAIPPRNNSLILTQDQLSTALIEMPNTNSDRTYFSLDVKPTQRDVYKSDQFSQTIATQRNGYVARIQGIKSLAQKNCPVWPKVYIPILFRHISNVRLVVYVVSEKLQNGIRIWSKHRDKGFLPKGFTRDSEPINPMEFQVTNLTIAGDLKLDLQMTTLWDKLTEHPAIYQLDEQSTIHLHPALHDPSSPRLLCLLAHDRYGYLNTICLSDFIRSKHPSKRTLPTTHDQMDVTSHKRAKAK